MGQYLIIEDFRRGLDPRKLALGAPAGTLTDFVNGHITNAGDIEKRKAFVEFADLDIDDDNGDPGIFGLQRTSTGLTVFGSAGLNGSAPAYSQPELASDIPVTSPVISYQKLTHPAVLEGTTYDRTKHRMTALVWSELFGGTIQAIADFADGLRAGYSNGSLVEDFTSGLVLAHLAGDVTKQAAHLKRLIDLSDGYTASQLTLTTTNRTRAANVATLTLSGNPLTSGLAIGSKVRVSGVGGAGYNSSLVTLTNVTSNAISYANVGSNEGSTADVGGTITTAVITVTGAVGAEFDVAASKSSTAGTISTPSNTVSAVAPVTGASATGSFTISGGTDNGVAAAAATGTITRTATNASAADYITIGKKKYTFRASPAVEGDVKIGATAADSLTNLQRAINHTGTPGTDYVCALPHPWVRAGNISGSNLPLTAFAGTQGNSIPLAESTATARYSVSGAALTGGAGNCISSIKVVSNSGSETELLSGAVRFQTDVSTTAAAVRDAINAYTGTSGYTATVNANTITVLSSDAANPMPNGYHLQIASGGDVLVGECLFHFTQQATTFQINNILVDGLDCLSAVKAFPSAPIDTFPEYYVDMVTTINSRSGFTGVNAWTNGQYIKLSRISTRDDDQPLTVYITPNNPTNPGVGIVFGSPPELALPLTVELPNEIFAAPANGKCLTAAFGDVTTAVPINSVQVAPVIKGGNGLYTFEWLEEYPATILGTINVIGWPGQSTNYGISAIPSNTRVMMATLWLKPLNSAFTNQVQQVQAANLTASKVFRLRVTDSFGNKALSNPCRVELQIVN